MVEDLEVELNDNYVLNMIYYKLPYIFEALRQCYPKRQFCITITSSVVWSRQQALPQKLDVPTAWFLYCQSNGHQSVTWREKDRYTSRNLTQPHGIT